MDRVCFLLRTKSFVPRYDLKAFALFVWQFALILVFVWRSWFWWSML